MSGDQLNLDEIDRLLATSRRLPPSARIPADRYERDVAALVAEVRRLRDRLSLLDPHWTLSPDDACPHGITYDLFCGECMSEA